MNAFKPTSTNQKLKNFFQTQHMVMKDHLTFRNPFFLPIHFFFILASFNGGRRTQNFNLLEYGSVALTDWCLTLWESIDVSFSPMKCPLDTKPITQRHARKLKNPNVSLQKPKLSQGQRNFKKRWRKLKHLKTKIFSSFLQQGTDTPMLETQCNLLVLFVKSTCSSV